MIYDEHQYFDKAKQLSYIDIYIYIYITNLYVHDI